MKLSDWLREEAAFSGLGEYAQAADLLDECETFMGRTEEKDLDVCSPEWWTEFYRLFAKLRAAQEIADESK